MWRLSYRFIPICVSVPVCDCVCLCICAIHVSVYVSCVCMILSVYFVPDKGLHSAFIEQHRKHYMKKEWDHLQKPLVEFYKELCSWIQLIPTAPDNKYHCLSTNIHHTQLKKATEDNHRWVFTRSSYALKLRHMGPVTMVAIFCLFVSLGKAHNPTLYWNWN